MPPRSASGCSIAALLVFERHLQLRQQLDLAVLELHVLRRDLGDAQVAERPAARSTAVRAAFSRNSLLVPISSMTL